MTPALLALAPQLVTYDLQLACPLFVTIPPELRSEIFLFALTPYPNTVAPAVPYDSFGFRPEYTHPLIQAVALLGTCRRIYLETHTLPTSLRTFISWNLVWTDRVPAGFIANPGPALNRLTPEQRAHARTFRIFAQQYKLERPRWARHSLGGATGRFVRFLTITLRHMDMWGWENDADAFRMSENGDYGEAWRQGFLAFPALEELQIELETPEWRKGGMEVLVRSVKRWKIPIAQNKVLSAEGIPVQAKTWRGSGRIQGGKRAPDGADTILYHVFSIRWRAR